MKHTEVQALPPIPVPIVDLPLMLTFNDRYTEFRLVLKQAAVLGFGSSLTVTDAPSAERDEARCSAWQALVR